MNLESFSLSCDCGMVRHKNDFSGWSDFDKFEAKLKGDVAWENIPVKVPYSNVGISERWYRCLRCSRVWRLVEPDPPFSGLWKEVSSLN
ncbi:hypothetical protein GTP81_25265 [Rugamonas sp. FT107W]|uniref:Uncharacterized protein n=1 Tax=Duganella vulcania TaxID=2692166 RepID=A0A845HRC4_9BURK|nr:hypothetical protein [Duganella vulcania]MYN20055.1 hypothetical protein [Duganella vulcania]